MKRLQIPIWVLTTVLLVVFVPMQLAAKEKTQLWDLVNPEGIIRIDPMTLPVHPASLEGKTIMLRWNGKHNGDVFLNRIAQRLSEHIDGVKIVKSWEVAPETVNAITGSQEKSLAVATTLSRYKPHIVIGAQAD